MFKEIVKMLEEFDHIERMEARVDGWKIDVTEYGGKRSIEFTRPLDDRVEVEDDLYYGRPD